MISTFICEETHSTSLKVRRDTDLLFLTLDGSDFEKQDIYLGLEELHSLIGHLLKIQKEIRDEGNKPPLSKAEIWKAEFKKFKDNNLKDIK